MTAGQDDAPPALHGNEFSIKTSGDEMVITAAPHIIRALYEGHFGPEDGLDLPVYDDIRNVPNPTEGTYVHVTGTVQAPAGIWWNDGDNWFAGTRTRIGAQQESVPANGTLILQQFILPEDTEINVWQGQALNISGTNTGLFIQVRDITAGTTFYEYDAAQEGGIVDIGAPIATGGSGGNEIIVRVENTTGAEKTITGFVVFSIQSTVTT